MITALLVAVALAGPHAEQMAAAPDVPMHLPRRGGLPDPTPGPDLVVYGYQAYWAADLEAVPWDHLTHIALFSAGVTTSGTLTNTSRWDLAEAAVQMAEPYGVKVHLCITNFDTAELRTLLGSSSAQSTLIATLVQWVEDTGVDGINVDFEGLPADRKQQMVAFTAALDAVVPDVVLATPAVDWSGAWDYSALTEHADLFIMGYGYHWSGSSSAGPVDPLHGGSPWGTHALDWTVDDYLTHDADPARVILGLPLYGYRWPVSSNTVPASTTGTGSAVFWADAQVAAAAGTQGYDAVSETPYWYDGSRQGWYQDAESLRERVILAKDEGIAGVGFWALHYDEGDPALWSMMAEETFPDPETPVDPVATDYTADAGAPFLAYVGDTVILSAAGSTGPSPMRYRWTQVAGPPVSLSDPATEAPRFRVREPGTTVFELEVGDGTAWSAPDTSYVIVLDPAFGRRYGCGCDVGGGAAGWAVWLWLPLWARRRRRSSAHPLLPGA